MPDKHKENPCLTCGACCARFRVSFYWGETDAVKGGTVPFVLTEHVTRFRLCMQGTNQRNPRCVALKGEIGKRVTCTIYATRPTTCREFGIRFEDGKIYATKAELERCNQARAAWGLPPLPASILDPNKPTVAPASADQNARQ
ncbi:MAG: YkgJ family cysteine cluster protein [Candidatus Eisenbacteria bacterium]|nr:YkgJ family cysteine cluster protein [Candidatus Eisenbacteria bacterium]